MILCAGLTPEHSLSQARKPPASEVQRVAWKKMRPTELPSQVNNLYVDNPSVATQPRSVLGPELQVPQRTAILELELTMVELEAAAESSDQG